MKNLISVIFIVMVLAATNVSAENNITLECECINLTVNDRPFEFSLFINKSLELEKVTIEYLRGGGQQKIANPSEHFSAEEIVILYGSYRTVVFNRTTLELSGVGALGEVKGSCEIKNTER
jgi:hypothetical protein